MRSPVAPPQSPPRGQGFNRWNRERVIEALRDLVGGGDFVPYHLVRKDPPLSRAVRRYFGCYRYALQAAGLSRAPHPYRRQERRAAIVKMIHERIAAGLPLNSNGVRLEWDSLYHRAVRRFGSWSEALRAADLDAEKCRARRRWTREQVLQAIEARKGAGLSVRPYDVFRQDRKLYSKACEHFSSWRAALEAVGVPYDGMATHLRLSDEEVLARVRAYVADAGSLVVSHALKIRPGLVAAARRHFGSWRYALEKAGIEVPMPESSMEVVDRKLMRMGLLRWDGTPENRPCPPPPLPKFLKEPDK